MKTNHNNFLKLAFDIGKINLGKTGSNPSVGCVVVKDNSVLSSGYTSLKGRPHAEYNALKENKNFKDADLYLTLEPCTHYGKTPPCTNIIIKKGIKRVFYSFDDLDKRTYKKSKKILEKKGIKVFKKKPPHEYKNYYKSYYSTKGNSLPLIDGKIAISKDFSTINMSSKWITNKLSRKRVHLLRSEYDCIISSSNTIIKDNALLNVRLNGANYHNPDLVIIDLGLKIKKNLKLFNINANRKTFIVTKFNKNKKDFFLRKNGVKKILIKKLKNKSDFLELFRKIKKKGYSRILVETGLTFLNELITHKLIDNLYVFQSSNSLGRNGKNNGSVELIKNMKLKNRVKVNLNEDRLYKIRF